MNFKNIIAIVLCLHLQGSRSYSGKRKGDLFLSYENPSPGTVLVSCAYCSDDRRPTMEVGEKMPSNKILVNTHVSNAYDVTEKCYLVTTHLLVLDALLPQKTTFECSLKDTLTGEVKNTSMEYVHSSAWKPVISARLPILVLVLDALLHGWR